MNALEQCLDLELKFEEKNTLIILFFNNKISTEEIPKIAELYQYSLDQYLESMEMASVRLENTKDIQKRLRILMDRDMYLSHIISANGIKEPTEEDHLENKSIK